MEIRSEQKQDWQAVEGLNTAAFSTTKVGELVASLRQQSMAVASLVATEDGVIKGHVLFSAVSLNSANDLKICGLGPLAVDPDVQRQGIGGSLIRAGLQVCKDLGFGAVVVLGHPEYYPRFGFEPSSKYGISCALARTPEAFMLLELHKDYLKGHSGVIEYAEAFSKV